jgi:hypothetical protein
MGTGRGVCRALERLQVQVDVARAGDAEAGGQGVGGDRRALLCALSLTTAVDD